MATSCELYEKKLKNPQYLIKFLSTFRLIRKRRKPIVQLQYAGAISLSVARIEYINNFQFSSLSRIASLNDLCIHKRCEELRDLTFKNKFKQI